DAKSRFFLVADGMGGQSAGERASGLATEIIPPVFGAVSTEVFAIMEINALTYPPLPRGGSGVSCVTWCRVR
ncbi:MAG: hypothetical protein NT069_30575, partial [Planctomycetota bacterium]|nr:hypothetical protein [Planctomycetota bacterium]